MQRREFITLLGGTLALPLTAPAQQPERMRRIGVLMAYAESDREGQAWVAAFWEGLQKLGWTEGRNIRIDTRWAAADVEAMQRFAKELVALQPDLILTQNTPCPYRNSHPDVLVVQSSEHRPHLDAPLTLNRPAIRRILAQG